MNLLLDTHVLLWCFTNSKQLTATVREKIVDGKNLVYVSAVSSWEIAIKKSLGKLQAPDNLEEMMQRNRFRELTISISHTLLVGNLPALHQDPFDRLLIAQAKHEGFTLVTHDKRLKAYDVSILGA